MPNTNAQRGQTTSSVAPTLEAVTAAPTTTGVRLENMSLMGAGSEGRVRVRVYGPPLSPDPPPCTCHINDRLWLRWPHPNTNAKRCGSVVSSETCRGRQPVRKPPKRVQRLPDGEWVRVRVRGQGNECYALWAVLTWTAYTRPCTALNSRHGPRDTTQPVVRCRVTRRRPSTPEEPRVEAEGAVYTPISGPVLPTRLLPDTCVQHSPPHHHRITTACAAQDSHTSITQ